METFNGASVAVTGAGGFIGSHLCEALVETGAKVRAFTHYNSRNEPGLLRYVSDDILRSMEIVSGDLRDPECCHKVVADCDFVFHLGALISIPFSYHYPREVIETNVIGTLNILEACRRSPVRRLLHTSTSEVYGSALRVPMDENHPLQGQSPYSASKIGADKLVESYVCSFGVPAVTIRPFNTYGPRQSNRAVIPVIISQALAGNQIHLGSVDTRRDFTYVRDTVNGFLKGALAQVPAGSVLNLGTGTDITIGEICDLVGEILGKPLEIIQDPQRMRPEKSEVTRLLSDNRQAAIKLGWHPEVLLRDGLQRTIEWATSQAARADISGRYLI
jgi:NAD dependent epimerase/dehydratase